MSESVFVDNDREAQRGMIFGWVGVLAGGRQALPLALGGCADGLVFGVLARQSHLSMLEVLLMSSFVNAGSAQLLVLHLWGLPPAFWPIVLTTGLVNLRMLLLGVSLSRWWRSLPPLKAYGTLFFLSDESWALTMGEFARGGRDAAFLLGSGLLMFVAWIGSTLLGCWLGAGIADPAAWGLDFAFTAVFLSLLVGLWKGKADILPWLVGAVVAVVSARLIAGNWYILLGALCGSIVGAIRHAD
ncbi:AzlC family ABC transporter permease [Dictyobacter formicarum]|uniref:Transporter n=1 Tax=Dictyobacter formicarum TaxID=2778368 RepID=A0ABQ3VMP3_9CHLR|nr:AzlC family ABC transporter permease [Dictyobacter formicarum]GHO86949.1 transporter [Dictyobacter formicarum]